MKQAKTRYKLSKRKMNFARFYFDFEGTYSPITYYNAYRCALRAGYSDSYAKRIMWRMSWKELENLLKISEKANKC